MKERYETLQDSDKQTKLANQLLVTSKEIETLKRGIGEMT